MFNDAVVAGEMRAFDKRPQVRRLSVELREKTFGARILIPFRFSENKARERASENARAPGVCISPFCYSLALFAEIFISAA